MDDVLLDLDRQLLDGLVENNEAVVINSVGCTLLKDPVLFLDLNDVGFGILELSLFFLKLLLQNLDVLPEFSYGSFIG